MSQSQPVSIWQHQASDSPSSEHVAMCLSILQYNQTFVHLTDSKASSLVLVSSILLAASTASIEAVELSLPLAALATSVLAILLCLWVVRVRLPGRAQPRRGQLAFFTHIADRQSAAHYRHDLVRSSPGEIVEGLAEQIYALSQVLDHKLKVYRAAQLVTMISGGLWVAAIIAPQLPR